MSEIEACRKSGGGYDVMERVESSIAVATSSDCGTSDQPTFSMDWSPINQDKSLLCNHSVSGNLLQPVVDTWARLRILVV